MKHLGDICKINGAEVEPVNVIIGGSPCQDLSVAGKRAGLDGERSGLFMEQIRIIKEMREIDRRNGRTGEFCRPRYMVWENVPGAFSSNSGEDFRTILEETARVADKAAVIPRPPKGRWANAGAVMGNRWSIAWRVLDAQFWGVPQRRRRIALVADFGGESAPEILFNPESLWGNIEQSRTERQENSRIACQKPQKQSIIAIFASQQYGHYTRSDVASTLTAHEAISFSDVIIQNQRPRRYTPLEAERLQGYPDHWTDIGDWTNTKGKKNKEADGPRYKACGNSIAIPCWRFILQGISERVTEHTMASLFDGIGGFPLIWEQINGSKSCRWVSEIEEFPIAVTKMRFEQE